MFEGKQGQDVLQHWQERAYATCRHGCGPEAF